jgi:hypothetical protein
MISPPNSKSASACTFAVLVDPLAITDELSPERAFASHNVSLINTGVRDLHWNVSSIRIPASQPRWVTAAVVQGTVAPGQRVYIPLALQFDPPLAYPKTNRSQFESVVTISAGEDFNISVTLRTVPGAVSASHCTVDGEQDQFVRVGSAAFWKLRTADKYGQRLRNSIVGKVKVGVRCDLGSPLNWTCTPNYVYPAQLSCCTDNLDGSYSIQVAPSTGSTCGVVLYVNDESLADRYPRLGVEARAADGCSSFNLTANGARIGRHSIIKSNQNVGVQYPSQPNATDLQVTLIPLKDSKQFQLSVDLSIDMSSLAIGNYMLELPASGTLPRCVLSNFVLQCAEGYETLNGEGKCYEISKAKVWVAAALSAILVLFLAALLIWVYKKRHGVKELFISVMKNEGMQGLQLGNEVLDLAGDAVVYHEVATHYRYMQGLFTAYTIAFPLSCFASIIAIGLKLKALRIQLRMRRRRLDRAVPVDPTEEDPPDRRVVLRTRLDTCRKEQTHTYAAVLCAALEDLPMGILSIVLTSMLPAGEKLSIVSQLSIAYSWFNLGGKALKATALLRLWAEERDVKRKLEKLDAAADTEAANSAESHSHGACATYADRAIEPPALVPYGGWHAVRRFVRKFPGRKNARQGDADVELVGTFVHQARAELEERAAKKASVLTRPAVLRSAVDDAPEHNSTCLVRAMCMACNALVAHSRMPLACSLGVQPSPSATSQDPRTTSVDHPQ